MKISVYVPQGTKEKTRIFLRDEIAQAQNIQDKTTRKSVISGLQKAVRSVDEGVAIFTDGDELVVEPYGGIRKLYYCGREYKKLDEDKFDPYLIVVFDSQEATIGTTDGENIRVLWTDESRIHGKHHMGGQSQARFQRLREQEVLHWSRSVWQHVVDLYGGRDIIIGGPSMTKDKFAEEVPV